MSAQPRTWAAAGLLEWLTPPIHEARADDRCRQFQQRFVDIQPSFKADSQLAKACKPAVHPLHHPLVFAQALAALNASSGNASSERLGKHQWVVEWMHSWFAGFGKLRIRFERRLDIHEALLKLAAAVICARFVDRWCSPVLSPDIIKFREER